MINWLAVALIITVSGCSAQDTSQKGNTIYDPDPQHLWNRLNETLFDRTAPDGKHFGLDELDILYWQSTKNLLVEPSHQQALAVLDEFINTHGEKLIPDPLKRVLLQRDLWELFDWSAKPFRKADKTRACDELQSRLVVLIRRLALTTNEIAALPDNYAQTEKNDLTGLPHGLFQTNGNWLGVGINGYNEAPVAPSHVSEFDGHSAFCVLLHVPEGRQAAISYLDSLRAFAQLDHVWIDRTNRFAWVSPNAPHYVLELNTNLPQFPKETEWALARRLCVIDTEGHMQPTSITESIQVRRYLKNDKPIPDQRFSTNDVQQFFEFRLDRRQRGELRAVGQKENGFPFVHFRGQGRDLFEVFDAFGRSDPPPEDSAKAQSVLLDHCYECHSGRGIYSVLSYTGFLSPPPSQQPTDLAPVDNAREAKAAIYWKQRQFDWGLLQGLWRQTN